MLNLPEPKCEYGYTYDQLEDVLGAGLGDFGSWMRGQTMTLCEGRRYNHDTKEYEESCGGLAHGGIVYRWDLERYLEGRPIID